MEVYGFLLIWVVLVIVAVTAAFLHTRDRDATPRDRSPGHMPGGTKLIVALAALGMIVAAPALVLAATSDRLPNGAGAFTVPSSEHLREGRTIFRETCASCHSLDAANARGVYGPNLDALGLDAEGSSDRIVAAIKNGGSSGLVMPKNLLEGANAKAVADYIAAVAGAGADQTK